MSVLAQKHRHPLQIKTKDRNNLYRLKYVVVLILPDGISSSYTSY